MDIFGICTSELCGHEPGKRCGKAINQENAKLAVMKGEGHFEDTGGWICDECWKRVSPTLK